MMRTAVIAGPGRIEIQETSLPDVGPGQVRVRLEGCGVCGSNLPVWEGRPWFTYPQAHGAPGHEGWGVIEAVGSQVRGLSEGDRVAALSYRAFGEFDVADAAAVVKLPEALERQPFPGEALGCAMNVMRRSGIMPGQTVAIVGVGFLGALLVNLASRRGAAVIAISQRTSALGIARVMGAAHALPLTRREEVVSRVAELTTGRLCAVVIEATGCSEPLTLAAELTCERGRLVIAGYHQDGPRSINMQLWNWRGLDVINAHERDPGMYRQGMTEAVTAVERGDLTPEPLYTHRFPLERLNDAFTCMQSRPADFMKALVIYG